MNISKFNFSELFSNDTGKTSMSATMGGILVFISSIVFAYASFTKYELGITQSVIMAGIGSTLLGIRKYMNNKETTPDKIDNPDEQ